jgi:hypothetical protein
MRFTPAMGVQLRFTLHFPARQAFSIGQHGRQLI